MPAIPLHVTEWMKGYVTLGATDYHQGYLQGLEDGTSFAHVGQVLIDDVDRFVDEPAHEARFEGTFTGSAFGERPFTGGTFNMCIDTPSPGMQVMLYRMPFLDGAGAPRTLLGHKILRDDGSLDLLNDNTTLYVRILEGDVPGPTLPITTLPGNPPPGTTTIAMGIVHAEIADAIRSLRTFRSPGSDPIHAAEAVARFGAFYFGRLWKVYGSAMRIIA